VAINVVNVVLDSNKNRGDRRNKEMCFSVNVCWIIVFIYKVIICVACNCFGHSTNCQYDAAVDRDDLSLDIHGVYSGGGRCINCQVLFQLLISNSLSHMQHNTMGINCNECSFGYYHPEGRLRNATDACEGKE
jgi:hypothetical protein